GSRGARRGRRGPACPARWGRRRTARAAWSTSPGEIVEVRIGDRMARVTGPAGRVEGGAPVAGIAVEEKQLVPGRAEPGVERHGALEIRPSFRRAPGPDVCDPAYEVGRRIARTPGEARARVGDAVVEAAERELLVCDAGAEAGRVGVERERGAEVGERLLVLAHRGVRDG